MIVGAYWAQRQESREQAAERMARFLSSLATQHELFSKWFMPGRSRAAALRAQVSLDPVTIASKLRVNRRDLDHKPIPELGFKLGIWNGKSASFSATVGAYSPYTSNRTVLSFSETPNELKENDWKNLLEAMIQSFDPDHAVVTSHEYLERVGAPKTTDAGWFTYERGGEIRQHPFE